MSKRNNNTTQKNTEEVKTVIEPEVVETTEGVTPEEGVNSINETKETMSEDVSVVDTQESTGIVEEESSTTISEEVKEEVSEESTVEHKEDVIPEPVPEVSTVEEVVTETKAETKKEFYVSLGTIDMAKIGTIKERVIKAGFTSAKSLDGELLIGPFENEVNCIKARKAIVSKGLKGKIVEK